LKPRNDDLRRRPRPAPEFLEHGRVTAAPDKTNVKPPIVVYGHFSSQNFPQTPKYC
jgi:hypothetical protein